MSNTTISLDPEKAAASANLLTQQYDQVGTVAAKLEGRGTAVGPAGAFKSELTTWVSNMTVAMNDIRTQLGTVQTSLTQAVADLAKQDATLADQTATFLAGVDAIDAPAVADGTSTEAYTSANSAQG